ncbi:MAG TPA: hypothetical protein VNY04_04570 [Chthoniobacterales bacterium]|nr:hypothetical protein [Chthoniobacterales bacterium]
MKGTKARRVACEKAWPVMRMMTGTSLSFLADWRRQILKIVLVLELELDC